MQAAYILRDIYGIEPALLIDKHKCNYSAKIHDISYLNQIDTDAYLLFLTSINTDIYDDIYRNAIRYFNPEQIIELRSMSSWHELPKFKTKIGKYSYGPICYNHPLIKSIGSFCSFAIGVDYVENHEFRYVTTHPIVFEGKNIEGYEFRFEAAHDFEWFMSGIEPRSQYVNKQRRAIIGNDVWLGRNVIVTNSANIGNGVIAAAGAVITKDVPDYAVVAGVPARIIRYRYSPEQIAALNQIAWWNWTDDQIRERFEDFYLPIEDFIEKYL